MKRYLALLLSTTMVLGSGVNAFADGETTTEPATAAAAITGGSADGTGEVVNTTQFRVVVPTTKKLDYIADPQGLVGLAKGASSSLEDLTAGAGKVYAKDTMSIANRSSKDVVVNVTASAAAGTDTGKTNVAVSDFTKVASDGTDKDATAIALALVPTEATFEVVTENEDITETVGTGDTAKTTKFKVTASVDDGDKYEGYLIGASTAPTVVSATLKRADYAVFRDEEGAVSYDLEDADAVGGAVQFAVAGKTAVGDQWATIDADADIVFPTVSVEFDFRDAGASATNNVVVSAKTGTTNIAATEFDSISVPEAEEVVDTVDDDDIAVDGKEITITGFTGTASDVSVKIDGEDATAPTDYTAVTSTDDTLTVTLAENSEEDRAVVVTFKVDDTTYTASATVEGVEATPEAGTFDGKVLLSADGSKTVESEIKIYVAANVSDKGIGTKGSVVVSYEGQTAKTLTPSTHYVYDKTTYSEETPYHTLTIPANGTWAWAVNALEGGTMHIKVTLSDGTTAYEGDVDVEAVQ